MAIKKVPEKKKESPPVVVKKVIPALIKEVSKLVVKKVVPPVIQVEPVKVKVEVPQKPREKVDHPRVIEHPDGRHTITGGFSTKNKEDLTIASHIVAKKMGI